MRAPITARSDGGAHRSPHPCDGNGRQKDRGAQNAADAGSLAGVVELIDSDVATAKLVAENYSALNAFPSPQVVVGDWDPTTRTFTVNETDGLCLHVVTEGSVDTSFGAIYDIDVLDVTASAIACAEPRPPVGGFPTIHANSGGCGEATIDWSGSDIIINGGVHTNDGLKAGGGGSVINGPTTVVTSIKDPGKITYDPSPPNPQVGVDPRLDPLEGVFDIADFRPGGAVANSAWRWASTTTPALTRSTSDGSRARSRRCSTPRRECSRQASTTRRTRTGSISARRRSTRRPVSRS